MRAYILIQAEPGADGGLAHEVDALEGVHRVERVRGPFDLIAEAEWDASAGLERRIKDLPGVLRALTSLVLADGDRRITLDEPEVAATSA